MMAGLWGNPHSENSPARLSGDMVDDVRAKTLRFLGADPRHFDLVFVANATAAIKLVADTFRDLAERSASKRFWLGYHDEVHTSILGIRALTKDNYHCFESDDEIEQWLDNPYNSEINDAGRNGLGLFAYPGQSNLSGRRLPKSWLGKVRSHPRVGNTYTLFDAAALAMTSPMSTVFADPDAAPDFTCLSLYKIFGFPDLGALVVRRQSGHILSLRRYFGGGTVAQMYPHNGDGQISRKGSGFGYSSDMWDLHDGLEDGTLPFHSILALGLAIDTHARLYDSMVRDLQARPDMSIS